MNQWYRKTVTKVTVLVIGILSGAIFLTSFGVVTTLAGTANPGEVMEMASEPYEESANFNQAVAGSVMQVFEQFRMKNLFETDGAYNPDKVIDIMTGGLTGAILPAWRTRWSSWRAGERILTAETQTVMRKIMLLCASAETEVITTTILMIFLPGLSGEN